MRVLLSEPATKPNAIRSAAFFDDPDVRWLAGVNQSEGNTWFNNEQFEELLTWLQLPVLIEIARSEPGKSQAAQLAAIAAVEKSVAAARAAAAAAGYNLDRYLAPPKPAPAGPANTPEPIKVP